MHDITSAATTLCLERGRWRAAVIRRTAAVACCSLPHWHPSRATLHIHPMCGRVIQSSGPLRYAIVDGLNVRDSRVHNYPPRWNAAPSQELLVIRRNHKRESQELGWPCFLGSGVSFSQVSHFSFAANYT